MDASPELRSKKQLIETFIAGINDVDDVMAEWHGFVAVEREKELTKIIQEEKLKEPEMRKFWRTLSGTVRSKPPVRTLIN